MAAPTGASTHLQLAGKQLAQRLRASKRRRRLPRQYAPRHPDQLEREYQRDLRAYLEVIASAVRTTLLPQLRTLAQGQAMFRPAPIRTDAEAKYYTAFIFDPTDQVHVLHCTHKYLGALTPEQVAEVRGVIDAFFAESPRELPRVAFSKREHFGERGEFRVLVPEEFDDAAFFPDLRATLGRFAPDQFPTYRPHVTTDAGRIDRPFTRYALITKAGIVDTWPKMRVDAAADDVDRLMKQINVSVEERYSEEEIRRMAQARGISVARWNKLLLARNIKKVIGINPLFGDPYLPNELALFTVANTSLITSMKAKALGDVQTVVLRGLQNGTRAEEIAGNIEGLIDPKVGNVAARANLIARDQVGKLNGQLTQLRQADLGIGRYRWRTMGDDRVRSSHREKNGKIFSWDDPPEDTGHPGEDYQCRCYAEPVLEDLVPGLDG